MRSRRPQIPQAIISLPESQKVEAKDEKQLVLKYPDFYY